MKKIYALLLLAATSLSAVQAQNTANYNFSVQNSVALESMTESTLLFGTMEDEASTQAINLPFTFNFNGTGYTQFSVSTNGLLGLGSTPVTDFYIASTIPCETYPVIMAWGEDLTTDVDGWIKYKITGTTGSRKLVVEWKAKTYSDDGPAANKHFQVWLHEGTDEIEFVYGDGFTDWYNGSTIGIASSDDDYLNVYATDHSTSTNTVFFWNDTWPGTATSYLFTPGAAAKNMVAEKPAEKTTLALPASNKLKVYPNPTTGQFSVEIGSTGASKVIVQILSEGGRLVSQQQSFFANGQPQNVSFNLSNQPAGIYIVKAVSDKGTQVSKVRIVR